MKMKKKNKNSKYGFSSLKLLKEQMMILRAVFLLRGKKLALNFLAVVIITGMNSLGLSAIGETMGNFNDTETSTANVFTAGSLDFSLTNTNLEEFIGIELGEDIEFSSMATKVMGSMGIQYRAYVEKISGDDDFCNALQMEVLHSQIYYDGDLMSFDTATTTTFGTWAFELKLPHMTTQIPHGVECNVDLVFEGWRDDVADFNQSGFTDEERIHLNLTSRMIVLNEFLPRPDGEAYGFDFGDDNSDMPQGEWVELYNNSNYAFDLTGWYIKDELETDTNKIMITDLNTVPAGTVIGAKSWLVVYMNKAVLNNDGDTVRLFDDSDNRIDHHTYSGHEHCELEPTPGDENSDITNDGDCDSIPPNKTYARISDGVGGWVDPIPTPGGANILDGAELQQPLMIVESVNNDLDIEPLVIVTSEDEDDGDESVGASDAVDEGGVGSESDDGVSDGEVGDEVDEVTEATDPPAVVGQEEVTETDETTDETEEGIEGEISEEGEVENEEIIEDDITVCDETPGEEVEMTAILEEEIQEELDVPDEVEEEVMEEEQPAEVSGDESDDTQDTFVVE